MEFRKYQHIERWGTTEVDGIENGTCWVFPKLDGTNASVWWDPDAEGRVCFGSRNRKLSSEFDNHGFVKSMCEQDTYDRFWELFHHSPHWRLYGEWLVPHTLKTYREIAWRNFYVFDVWDGFTESGAGHIPWEIYSPVLLNAGISCVDPMCSIENPTAENILREVNKNTYLIEDGKGLGEGVVVKNYRWVNKYGRQTWAKMVRNEFKEENGKEMGFRELKGTEIVELKLADRFCTRSLVDKVAAKIEGEAGGWSSKLIPRLLQTVYYDMVREESWEMVKTLKNPKVIDYSRLQKLVTQRVKVLLPELF